MKKWIAILALCALGVCGAMQEGALAVSRSGEGMDCTPRMMDGSKVTSGDATSQDAQTGTRLQ